MRQLPPALKTWLDAKLPPVAETDPTKILLLAAEACIGIREEGADNHGPLVELFQSTISRPQGQSWCLDFVEACVAYAEARCGVQSPLPAVEHVLTLWNQGKASQAVSDPLPGDLIVWEHGTTSSGHVGLIVHSDSLTYWTIEGNTGPGAGIEREGDGVYAKRRAKGGSKTFKELGFLRVFSAH